MVFSCFTWLEIVKSEDSGSLLYTNVNSATSILPCSCGFTHSVQLNSPHITSAETEGSKPKFIQGQSVKVNLVFSVLCRGGVHAAGRGDLSARE